MLHTCVRVLRRLFLASETKGINKQNPRLVHQKQSNNNNNNNNNTHQIKNNTTQKQPPHQLKQPNNNNSSSNNNNNTNTNTNSNSSNSSSSGSNTNNTQQSQKQENEEIDWSRIVKKFKESWENEAKNGYKGVIFPSFLTGCFMVYYLHNHSKIRKLQYELYLLKKQQSPSSLTTQQQQEPPESLSPLTTQEPSQSQVTGTDVTSQHSTEAQYPESEKQLRKQRRIVIKQIKDQFDQNFSKVLLSSKSKGGDIDEQLLKKEIHKLLIETDTILNTSTVSTTTNTATTTATT